MHSDNPVNSTRIIIYTVLIAALVKGLNYLLAVMH